MNGISRIIFALTTLLLVGGNANAEDSQEYAGLRQTTFSMYEAYYCTLEFNPDVNSKKVLAAFGSAYIEPHYKMFQEFWNPALLARHVQTVSLDAIRTLDQLSTSTSPITRRIYLDLCKVVPSAAKKIGLDLSMYQYE